MSWIEAGDVGEREGSWVVVDRHHQSAVVVRTAAGLRAFHNVCQHRGHRLVDGRGCAKAFVCPYHHWTYTLEGRLRHVPDVEGFGPDFDPADHGLAEVPLRVGDDGSVAVKLPGDTVVRCAPAQARGLLPALYEAFDARVLRGALDPARCGRLVAALEARSPREFRFSPAFDAFSVGRILDHAVDLDDYFAPRAAYRALLDDVDPGLEADLLGVLQQLAGDAELGIPEHPDHGVYGLTTIRRYPTGGHIPPHADTEQLAGPQYAHLRTLLDTTEIVSWFCTLQAPDAGGELALYDVGRDSELGRQVYADRLDAVRTLSQADVVPVRPEAGDLLVFASGRSFHRVVPVEGPRARWTVGGFIGRGKDGRLYAFS